MSSLTTIGAIVGARLSEIDRLLESEQEALVREREHLRRIAGQVLQGCPAGMDIEEFEFIVGEQVQHLLDPVEPGAA